MEFDLSIFDWTAFGAVVTALMMAATLYTVYQNRIQLNELKKQWQEENRPRIYPRIMIYNEAYYLEFHNSGKQDAFDIIININKSFIDNLPAKSKELIYDWINSPFFIKSSSSVYAFIGWCKDISEQWENADFNLEITGIYNNCYNLEFSLPVSQFTKRNMVVRTPIEHALERLAKGLVRPNRITHLASSQEQLEDIANSLEEICELLKQLKNQSSS